MDKYNPDYYNAGNIECIVFTENLSFCLGNSFKYLFRSGCKAGETVMNDLRKALWYVKRARKTPSANFVQLQPNRLDEVIKPLVKLLPLTGFEEKIIYLLESILVCSCHDDDHDYAMLYYETLEVAISNLIDEELAS